MSGGRGGTRIYVGNIPHEISDEKIREVFSMVGRVISIDLKCEKDGKRKGFGFIEFPDAETAEAAIRNLNNYEISGRNLRVGAADQPSDGISMCQASWPLININFHPEKMMDSKRSHQDRHGGEKAELSTQRYHIPLSSIKYHSGAIGQFSITQANEIISQQLTKMHPQVLLEVVMEMKRLEEEDPDAARMVLTQYPQFSFTLSQIIKILQMQPTSSAPVTDPEAEMTEIQTQKIPSVDTSRGPPDRIGTHHAIGDARPMNVDGLPPPQFPNPAIPGYRPPQVPGGPAGPISGQFPGVPTTESGALGHEPSQRYPARINSMAVPPSTLDKEQEERLMKLLTLDAEKLRELPPQLIAQIELLRRRMLDGGSIQ